MPVRGLDACADEGRSPIDIEAPVIEVMLTPRTGDLAKLCNTLRFVVWGGGLENKGSCHRGSEEKE
jgi:hypothetical protein